MGTTSVWAISQSVCEFLPGRRTTRLGRTPPGTLIRSHDGLDLYAWKLSHVLKQVSDFGCFPLASVGRTQGGDGNQVRLQSDELVRALV